MVRFKSRYIIGEIVYEKAEAKTKNDTGDVYTEVRKALQELHGDYAVASSMSSPSLRVVFLSQNTNMLLIRVRRGLHELVQSALVFIQKIGKVKACIRTLHLAGTIRSAKTFLIAHHKTRLTALIKEARSEEERKAVQDAIVRSNEECSRNLQLYFN